MNYLPGLAWMTVLLICASWVAGIAGVSHQHLAGRFFLLILYFCLCLCFSCWHDFWQEFFCKFYSYSSVVKIIFPHCCFLKCFLCISFWSLNICLGIVFVWHFWGVALGFELRVSHLLGRHSCHFSHSGSPFVVFIFYSTLCCQFPWLVTWYLSLVFANRWPLFQIFLQLFLILPVFQL
jgi:hypothetical protein